MHMPLHLPLKCACSEIIKQYAWLRAHLQTRKRLYN